MLVLDTNFPDLGDWNNIGIECIAGFAFKLDTNFPDLGDWNSPHLSWYIPARRLIRYKFPRSRGLKPCASTAPLSCVTTLDTNFPDLGDWNKQHRYTSFWVISAGLDTNFPDLGDWNEYLCLYFVIVYTVCSIRYKFPRSRGLKHCSTVDS